jgi:rhodanese-related sulfurtransferase
MLPSSVETAEITVAELAMLTAAGSSPVPAPLLVDCREPDEHAICNINGSVLIPLSTFAANAEAALPDKGRPLIIYCHHGMRSQRATEFLRRKGYTESFSLVGGIHAWAEAVEPEMPRY